MSRFALSFFMMFAAIIPVAQAVSALSLGPISAADPHLRLFTYSATNLRSGFAISLLLDGDPVQHSTWCVPNANLSSVNCSGLGLVPATLKRVTDGVVIDLNLSSYLPNTATDAGTPSTTYVHWEDSSGWWPFGPARECVLDNDDQAQCDAYRAQDPVLSAACLSMEAKAQEEGGLCTLVCICYGAGSGGLIGQETGPIEVAPM